MIWTFEPGHTEAEFRARHMMVSWVRGLFKGVEGTVTFDPDNPQELGLKTTIKADTLWTGEQQRDDHLRSADFLDVEKHPEITFASTSSERTGATDYKLTGDLTIRGITKEVVLKMRYLGSWPTPYWVGDTDYGPVPRLGFSGTIKINRHDFKVDWNSDIPDNGFVVSHDIHIGFDIEALPEKQIKEIEQQTAASKK